jgi:hypothetical protein
MRITLMSKCLFNGKALKPAKVKGDRPLTSKTYAATQPPMTAKAFRLVEMNHKPPSTNRLRRHVIFLKSRRFFIAVSFYED